MKDLIRDIAGMVLGEFCAKPWGINFAAWTVSENVVKLSQEAHVYLSYRQTQLFLQTSALPPRDGLQVFL